MQKIASPPTLISAADVMWFYPDQVTTAIIFNVLVFNKDRRGVLTARQTASRAATALWCFILSSAKPRY